MGRFFQNSNNRNSSVELLRILSIFGVVILHYNNKEIGGGFKYVIDGSFNQYYLFFSESIFIGAVNLFIMISGYFLSKTQQRSFTKVLELLFQVSLFRTIPFLYSVICGGETFSFPKLLTAMLPHNYFLILYCAVYIISPYINIILNLLNKKAFQKMLITVFVLFSMWTILWDYFNAFFNSNVSDLSTISAYGSMNGYTIVNFCLAYLIGAYIRRYPVTASTTKVFLVFILISIIIFAFSLFENICNNEKLATWNYNNPLVLVIAACALIIFLRFNIKSKIINEVSGATFICFLTHTFVLSRFDISGAVQGSVVWLIIHQVIVALCCYIVAYIVFKLYTLCFSWIFKYLKPLTEKVNISVNL